MQRNATVLGQCPTCDAAIPRGQLLLEYETDRGWPEMFAECQDCGDVVHPS